MNQLRASAAAVEGRLFACPALPSLSSSPRTDIHISQPPRRRQSIDRPPPTRWPPDEGRGLLRLQPSPGLSASPLPSSSSLRSIHSPLAGLAREWRQRRQTGISRAASRCCCCRQLRCPFSTDRRALTACPPFLSPYLDLTAAFDHLFLLLPFSTPSFPPTSASITSQSPGPIHSAAVLFLISPAAEQLNAHRRRLIVVPALPSLGISSPTSSPSALPTITAKVPNSPKKESQEQQPIGSASKVARAMSQPEPGGDDGGKQPAEKPAAAETAAAADGPVRGTCAGKEKSGAASDAQPQQQQPPVKQKTPSGNLDPRPGGSASSAAPTDDAESQATTTNVDESGDSESGGHNEPGKMFVGGLSWQTSAEGLRDYFCKFGEVNECMVMRDPTTKRARGFGFITFADPTAVEKVLALEAHELDGKRIDPKIAFPKKQQPKMVIKTKKVFIGGLSSSSTLEDIKTYFTQYGRIEDAMLMFDKSTQRHRGFGFITFDDDDVSDKVCEIHFHEINGKMVECKKAQPKEVMLPLQLNKTRAAAARNLYGLAPEQLLAYASYIPRPPAYGPVPSHHHQHHHHGMMATAAYSTAVTAASELPPGLDFLRIGAVPSAVPFSPGNGYPHPHSVPAGSTHHPSYGGGRSGHQQQMGNNNGGLHARDLAAAQLVAQQQAVYEALVYANQLSSLAASASADFSTGPAAFGHAHHHQQQHHGHHSHPPMHHHHQQQQQTSGAQQYMPTAVVTAAPTALHSAAGPAAQQQQPAPPQQFSKP